MILKLRRKRWRTGTSSGILWGVAVHTARFPLIRRDARVRAATRRPGLCRSWPPWYFQAGHTHLLVEHFRAERAPSAHPNSSKVVRIMGSHEQGSLSPSGRSRRIGAVDRAIDVITMLSNADADLSLTAIATYVGMSKSAVYELLRTLQARHLVERDPETLRYRLSWTVYELGATVLHRVALPSAAGYYLDRLAVRTGQYALLGILQHRSVLYLVRGEAPPGLSPFANAGRRFPLHATASGKVLLAFHQDSNLMEDILGRRLEKVTDATITDPQRLRTEIGHVRAHGFATCWMEGERDLCSVAMPVRDHLGRIVAAMALVGGADRLTPSTVRRLIPPLTASVRAVEGRLGLVAATGGSSIDEL